MKTYNRFPWSTSWTRDDAAARLDEFLISDGASVLDIGCADAWFAIELATMGHVTIGYEPDDDLYQMAFECLTATAGAVDVTLRHDEFIGQESAGAMLVLSVLNRLPVEEGLAWLERILPSAERTVCLELWLDDLPPFAQGNPTIHPYPRADLLAVLKAAKFTVPAIEVILPGGIGTTLLQCWRWGKKPR